MDGKRMWMAECVTLGLLGGVAVSMFSKTLALLFGLLVFGVQVRIPESTGVKWMLIVPIKVRGIERNKYLADEENSAVCQRDKLAVCH